MSLLIRLLVGATLLATLPACETNPNAPSRAEAGRGTTTGTFGPDYRGRWEGTFRVETCNGTGSIHSVTCRELIPPHVTMILVLRLSGVAAAPTGTLTLGPLEGHVDGVVDPSGQLSLSGTVRGDDVRVTLRDWSATRQDRTMTGSFSFRAGSDVFNGNADGTARIRVLGLVD